MKWGTGNWLQIKVVAGLTALVLGASVLVGYLTVLAEENHASQELLSRVRQLEVHGQAIQRRGLTYANNAPRDYGPYDRDVVIFYPDFMQDLDAFDRQLESMAKAAAALPSGPFHAASHGWRGLLMIAAAQPGAYTAEQVKLMGNLSRHLANGLAHADAGEAAVEAVA